MRTRDPETGYIAQTWLGHDYGPDRRCKRKRCGGRGMWPCPPNSRFEEGILCLRCADEWFQYPITDKYRTPTSRLTPKRCLAAFQEFLQTKPTEVDIADHNRRIESTDNLFFGAFPHLKKLVEEAEGGKDD